MTLERWLEIATHGLAPEAVSRVRREYADAFHDAHDAGERNVLAGWGDPHRVNRELRRAHLTTREARALHSGYAPMWAGLRQALREDFAALAGLFVFALLDVVLGDAPGTALWWAVGGLVLLSGLRWLLVSRLPRWPRGRAVGQWLLQPMTLLLAALPVIAAQEFGSGRDPLNWLMLEAGATGLEIALRLGAAAVLAAHLLRLPTALRAAAKLEGEAA